MLVSVIVPVYKAEKWLHRCVDSILAQTMEDFELLLIDDGSPDRSGEICDEYAKKDSRVRVFHKENGGVSSARNLGLDNAQGEWISFVDADDWVEVDYLAGLTEKLDADFISGGMRDTVGNISRAENKYFLDNQIGDFINTYYESCFVRAAWGKLIRRKIIEDNNLMFDDKIRSGEDNIFNKKVLLYSKSVLLVGQINYNYYIDNNISIQDKYNLSFDEISYALSVLWSINNLLNKRFSFCCEVGEYREHFFQAFKYKDIMSKGIEHYYALCKKYYPSLNFKDILENTFFSPIVKGILQLKIYLMRNMYVEANDIYDEICFFVKDLPWLIKFQYKSFYLWYFFVKMKLPFDWLRFFCRVLKIKKYEL